MGLVQTRATMYTFAICVAALPMGLVLATLVGASDIDSTFSSCAATPVVDLGYSSYQGLALNAGVNQFLGMRYAAPPLGDLRWRAPESPETVTGLQNATQFAPICLGMTAVGALKEGDEDCLFINVWTPSEATPASKLPVWVFFQGGGYIVNGDYNYNGTKIVDDGKVVFVNFNYRVGAWGFLASEKVKQDGDVNIGLLDQRKALEWVQQHIASFGGNPDHVVIHGDSAGAGSVALQLTAYGGRDDRLFIGVIGESVFFPQTIFIAEVEWQFERFLNDTSCNIPGEEMSCLRGADVATIQAANTPSAYPGRSVPPIFYFTPVVDGEFVPDHPYNLFTGENFVKVPIMFGDDTDEGTIFAPNATSAADISSFYEANFLHVTESDTEDINKLYPLMSPLPGHAAYFPSAAAAYGESTFICPGILITNSFVSAGVSTWSYRVNVQDPAMVAAGLGVSHTMELPAIFGPGFTTRNPEAPSFTTTNAPIVPVFMSYWTSFVKTLDPNTLRFSGSPQWAQFSTSKRRLRLQTNNTAMEDVPVQQNLRCNFWTQVFARADRTAPLNKYRSLIA